MDNREKKTRRGPSLPPQQHREDISSAAGNIVAHGYTLESLLKKMGVTKQQAFEILDNAGMNDADRAFAFLRSQDRLPNDISIENWRQIHPQIMSR